MLIESWSQDCTLNMEKEDSTYPIEGTLHIKKNGEAYFKIKPPREIFLGEAENIKGELSNDKKVVFLNCFSVSATKIIVNKVIVGDVLWGEKKNIDKLTVSIEGLKSFIGDELHESEKYKEIKFNLDGMDKNRKNSLTIRDDCKLDLSFKDKLDITQCIEIVGKINCFFCFFVNSLLMIKSVHIFSEGNEFDLIYRTWPSFEVVKKPANHRNLLGLDGLDLLNKWLYLYEKGLKKVLNSYFSSKSNDYSILDGKFLALARALEGLHRAELENLHKNIKNIAHIQKKGERISFLERLIFIIYYVSGSEDEKVFKFMEGFSTRLKDRRNSLTHIDDKEFNIDDKEFIIDACKEVYDLYNDGDRLFKLAILKILGKSDQYIKCINEDIMPHYRK